MGASVVDAILRGHRGAWIGLFSVVIVTVAVVLALRESRTSPAKVLLLSALVSVLSAGGILVAMGLAMPRIVWRKAGTPPFAARSGEVWRALRAPSAVLVAGERPEIGLAGASPDGRIQLYGLFSGAPIEGLPDAPNVPPSPGQPRICRLDQGVCVAWPSAWPEPGAAPSGSGFVWTRSFNAAALAFDVESGLFLDHVEGMRAAGGPVAMAGASGPEGGSAAPSAAPWALDQVGKLTNEPSHEGPTALFVVRRISGGRLDAVRVVAVPDGESFLYSVERATVSLGAAPAAFRWFARPALLVLVLWFPLATILLQAAPAWWASRRRKLLAQGGPVSEMPSQEAKFASNARQAMSERLYPIAVLAAGLAMAAPAVVAVAGMFGVR